MEGEKPKVEEVGGTAEPQPHAPVDVADEKAVVTAPPPAAEPDDTKALAIVEKVAEPAPPALEKDSGGSINRDAVLAKVESEKKVSLIKAWEENEKTKAENKFQKRLSDIGSWENAQKAALEAKLKSLEESYEKKKAACAEKMKNKVAIVHKSAEEKRAIAEAKKGEELLVAEEKAAKYRATGLTPKKLFGCFGS
ncbi:remorin-like [Nymphaea colorata]|nr:remorin-like [Nymphaea colorata]